MYKAIRSAFIVLVFFPILACSISGIYYPSTVTEVPQRTSTETATATPLLSSTPTLTPTATPSPTWTPTPTPIGMLQQISIQNASELTWSPDGTKIALLAGNQVTVYKAADLSVYLQAELTWSPVQLSFSLDGKYLATCEEYTEERGEQGHFAVWDVSSAEKIHEQEIEAPSCPVQFIQDHTLIFYAVRGGGFNELVKEIRQWRVGEDFIDSLKFAHRGPHTNWLIGITADGSRAMFRTARGQLHQELEHMFWVVREGGSNWGYEIPIKPFIYAWGLIAPDDRYIVISEGLHCSFLLLHIENGIFARSIDFCDSMDSEPNGVSFHPGMEYIAYEDESGPISVWDIESESKISSLTIEHTQLIDFEFNPVEPIYAILTRGLNTDQLSLWSIQDMNIDE